jgi:hypothetical protein
MNAVFKATLPALLLLVTLSSVAQADNLPAPLMNDPKFSFLVTAQGDNVILMYNPESVADIPAVMDEARDAYEEMDRFFGGYPYRTNIVVAGTNGEYRLFVNVGNAPDTAKARNWNVGYNGLIVIKSPEMLPDYEQVLTHQMARIAVRTRLNTTYKSLPEWYQDGLAAFVAGDITQDQRSAGVTLAITGQWMSLEELEWAYTNMTIFNFDEKEYSNARAQAATLVDNIGTMYGGRKLVEIVDDYARCGNLSQAFVNQTTFTPEALNTIYLNLLSGNDTTPTGQAGNSPSPTVVPVDHGQQNVTAVASSPPASATPESTGFNDWLLPGLLIALNAIVVLIILVILRRNWH